MSDLDTEIDGDAAGVRSVARWLRQELRPGFDDLATTVVQQRADAAGDWLGEAGTAFAGRARELARSADDGATISRDVATVVDGLAEAMRAVQDAMADVREQARAGGLRVDGQIVRHPGGGPPTAGTPPAPDATPMQWETWTARDAAAREHEARVEVWNACVRQAERAQAAWQRGLEAAAGAWQEHDTRYVNISGALVTAGIQLELIRRTTPHLTGEVDRMLTRAAELRGHLQAMETAEGRVLDRKHYRDLLEEAEQLEADHPAARRAINNWQLPKGLTRGFWAVDIAAAGYGIHSDWEEEGPTQAVASNVLPMGAGIGASIVMGAGAGAVVGSFVPIPGLGTAVGVAAGGVAGLAVGAFTSGAVDSLFDSGADALDDWGTAVTDGLEEVGATFGSVIDGGGDVFDAIF